MKAVGILCASVLLVTCASQPESAPERANGGGEPAATTSEATPESSATDLLSGEGRIVSIGDGDIVIDHEGIGWNEPMEQRFQLKDASVAEGFQPGDEVRFWVMMTEAAEGYVDLIEKQ